MERGVGQRYYLLRIYILMGVISKKILFKRWEGKAGTKYNSDLRRCSSIQEICFETRLHCFNAHLS